MISYLLLNVSYIILTLDSLSSHLYLIVSIVFLPTSIRISINQLVTYGQMVGGREGELYAAKYSDSVVNQYTVGRNYPHLSKSVKLSIFRLKN